jgi:signal transduction histidine kinase
LAATHEQLLSSNTQLIEQIAERERAETLLRQSQKMEAIGQLTGGVAHDFNNMLSVISGSLDLMYRRLKRHDFNLTRYMDAASEAAKRASVLTQRLLAFARQQPLSPEVIDANRMIASMADLLRSTLGEHIEIENVAGAGLWSVKTDAHQLENAILNVAINARDAMREGGRLTLETANAFIDDAYAREHFEVQPGQYVMIAITDTGSGMPADVVDRAFDPFFTTKAPGAGTGLGLSQVFGFVKQSKGHIKIYSEVGSGTTLKIYLPRFIGAAEAVSVAPAAPIAQGRAEELVLVVEDEALVRRLAVESLRELGYAVIESASAEAALRVI